ncbi:MAG TPA: hypothetical protein VLE89_07625 [Chlamydiales bacterium]|nr:hypothetical protein [Chlamydiales bacterium]
MAQNITVIGLNRGLCLALHLEESGYSVLGVDLSSEYVSQINQKRYISPEPGVTESLQKSRHFTATTSLEEGLAFSNVCFIVVPTNSGKGGAPYDDRILTQLLTEINSLGVSNKQLVITCTVPPGYIKHTAIPLIENCANTTISYNPEIIAHGEIMKGLSRPDLVLIGEGSQQAGDLLESIYKKSCANQPHIARMSVESAEIAKMALNCFVTAKIAFANLVGDIADETPGADKEAILGAIGKDQRIGSKFLKPGYSYGGPYLPRDNKTLAHYAETLGIEPLSFIATDRINSLHVEYQAKKLLRENRAEFVFDDVCYKSKCPVPIIEESAKLRIAKYLREHDQRVVISDREEVILKVQEEYGDLFNYRIE